jgi:menaquinone-dependent protoporphyrinogen oxidase
MKILVAYASRLGSTKSIAERIAAQLGRHDLHASARSVGDVVDVTPFDAFVMGSAVYAGHWLKEASQFVRDNRATISARPVWLFSSGPVGRFATNREGVEPAEVDELRSALRARDHRIFAGALDRRMVDGADLGFAERFIAKRFVPEGDFRDWPQIDAWADDIAQEIAKQFSPEARRTSLRV